VQNVNLKMSDATVADESVALQLGIVIGDGWSRAFHVVVPRAGAIAALKRNIATTWCSVYWEEVMPEGSKFEDYVKSRDLEKAFDDYF
jgi:hypothetical protein